MNEPSLDPPNGPDVGDPCKECGKPIEDECIPVELPGPRLAGPIYVCSLECRSEYLQGWADHHMDSQWGTGGWDWD